MRNKKLRKKIDKTRKKLATVSAKLEKLETKQARRVHKKAAAPSSDVGMHDSVN